MQTLTHLDLHSHLNSAVKLVIICHYFCRESPLTCPCLSLPQSTPYRDCRRVGGHQSQTRASLRAPMVLCSIPDSPVAGASRHECTASKSEGMQHLKTICTATIAHILNKRTRDLIITNRTLTANSLTRLEPSKTRKCCFLDRYS